MPLPPLTTPVPLPVFMPGMSHAAEAPTATAAPTPSPIPIIRSNGASQSSEGDKDASSSPKHLFPTPRLRLQIHDLAHAGASIFLASCNPVKLLSSSIETVLRHLYLTPSTPNTQVPSTRSVTLILRDMGGVAYTTGSDLDDDHKEIHFSMNYIAGISEGRRRAEIAGVVVHELVHCFQYNGKQKCPGGLIEGVADWVRLNAKLDPPHWKREATGRWDGGYQHTAFFLEYLEGRFGEGTVRRLNEKLRVNEYKEKSFWTELLGAPVGQFWDDYVKRMKGDKGDGEDGELVTDESESVDEATQT